MSMTEFVPSSPESGADGATTLSPPSDPPVPGGDRGDPASSGRRPSFTITDAAAACAVSRKTITRKLPELALNGAAKDDDGIWRIPVEALLAVGLHPGRSLVADARPASGSPVDLRATAPAAQAAAGPAGPEMVTISRDRWDDVRIRLARAEAEAAERALALADARLALRALTAGPASAVEPPRGSGYASGAIALGSAAQADGAHADPDRTAGDVEPDLFDARSHAARNGYAPATAPPARKRRWWQSA